MDEPFGALDPITKQNLIDELKAKHLFNEKTVVIVTHDVFEAITLGDIVCLLDDGHIKQIGTPKEMLFKPNSEFVKEFFDAQRFRLELRITTLAEILAFVALTNNVQKNSCDVNESQSIWETLELIEKNNQLNVSILKEGNFIGTTTPEELLNAFYQYKRQWNSNLEIK